MRNRRLVQLAATAVAATSLLVAVLGLVPGITTDYDQSSVAGHESDATLVGLFQVSVLHNTVRGVFGVIGPAMAESAGARTFVVGGRIVYLVRTASGFVIDHNTAANLVPVNQADNVLGIAMISLAS